MDNDNVYHPLTPICEVTRDPAHGTIYRWERGIFSYNPERFFVGEDLFRYKVCSRSGCSNIATVHVTADP